ncbi:hypothetical protein M406DRAFT_322738 [Cryphonectria parasitica EP155]|uniref:LCCL domain-containing protein n=1 Tax=Cryphonectria parasitica (strain ATCC 38755 / EP155) TaxID=660469 RepID=A0A9P5CP51_CRYP1|nr:uncharacterized protein M406DRAFT_322738 [Cryphonectria parasitica EP155]KAF3764811.1 hypothetical protein M406DRAFT_322738 [Cryphonectria parasitica EP155]
MAAPATKTLHDLNGTWSLNKTLSDDVSPALELQGVGWLTRKAIGLASVTLHVKQYVSEDGKEHVDIEQTATGGLKGTSEHREMDGQPREHKDWLFGRVSGRSEFVTEIPGGDAFLLSNWEEGTSEWLLNSVDSLDNGWTARQTWGFQQVKGERRYVRNVVVEKGEKRAEIRMVYDWIAT